MFAKKRETQTVVEFRSQSFQALPSEEHDVNPGRWGKRLADFLSDGLQRSGYKINTLPFAEDWGWTFQVEKEKFMAWVDCGNVDRMTEEDPHDAFRCFINPCQSFLKTLFFRKTVDSQQLIDLKNAIDDILNQEPSIREKRWLRRDE